MFLLKFWRFVQNKPKYWTITIIKIVFGFIFVMNTPLYDLYEIPVNLKKVLILLVHCCTKCKCIFSCVYLVAISKYIWIISLCFICSRNIKINVKADRSKLINVIQKLHIGREQNVMLACDVTQSNYAACHYSYIWLQWLQAATNLKQFDIILQLL